MRRLRGGAGDEAAAVAPTIPASARRGSAPPRALRGRRSPPCSRPRPRWRSGRLRRRAPRRRAPRRARGASLRSRRDGTCGLTSWARPGRPLPRTRRAPRPGRRGRTQARAGAAPGRTRRPRRPRASPARRWRTDPHSRPALEPSSVPEMTSKSAESTATSSRREEVVDRPSARRRLLDRAGSATRVCAAAAERSGRAGRAAAGAGAWLWRRAGKRRLELAERLRRTVPEGHSLLDLEVERDPAVVDAAAVLDRDERKEALELPGTPHGLLVGREWGGTEAMQVRLERRQRPRQPRRRPSVRRGRPSARRRARRPCRAPAALACISVRRIAK